MNQSEVMAIVQRMCSSQSDGCRSLNKSADARLLMDAFFIPKEAKIWEIPVDWDNMIVVVFEIPGDDNCYNLFAGIGCDDKKYHFEISIDGKIIDGKCNLDDFEEIILAPDYFSSKSAFYQEFERGIL